MIITEIQTFLSYIKKSSAILFDLDGTIFDLNISWSSIKEYILNHYETNFNDEIIEMDRLTDIFNYIKDEQGNEELEYYLNYVREQEIHSILNNQCKPKWLMNYGISKIAELIRYDCFYAIISNNFHETIVEVLNKFDSQDKFRAIIGRNDVPNAKPNPEGIIRIMDNFNLSPEEVIFIGDSKVDEETAKNAQINFIYVDDLESILKEI